MEHSDSNRIPSLIVGRRRNGRHIYSDEGKRALVAACLQPGVSVSRIAYDNGVNANLVRKWMREFGPDVSAPSATLLPVITLPERVAEKKRRKPAVPDATTQSSIEIIFEQATLRLHGAVDAAQLRLVIDCLTQS